MTDGRLLTTTIFNPALLTDEELVRGFVARQPLLDRLLDDIKRVDAGAAPQHQLIIGQRGLGKTTLLRRLAIAIKSDLELAAKWIPLEFPEEQYNVKNLADFWLNCADALSDALDRSGDDRAALALDEKVARIPKEPELRSAAALSLLMDEAARLERGLALLVDNLDIVLDRLNKDEEWEFRRVISEEHRLYFVGGSSRALESFYDYGRAFYDFFQVHELKAFDDTDMFALLERLADQSADLEVQKILKEKPARVRALRVLTGGNPRTLVLLYRVLSQGPGGDVRRDIEQLLDLYTPLYKARFEEMSPQAQQVVDIIAINWNPISAGEITQKLGTISVNHVSAQLKRLEDFGVIEKTARFGDKKTAFQISERFFNIWYLMRASRRERRKLIWLVRFLEAWFEQEELTRYAETLLAAKSNSADDAEIRFAVSQAIENPLLRRGLASAGLRMALQDSVREQFDFSGLPDEVLEQKERIELLGKLEQRIVGLAVDGVDTTEFWRLLGGSPFLTLLEKKELVEEKLPALSEKDVRELFAKLQREERRLLQCFYDEPGDVRRLYQAIATGEMADAWDINGALALERPHFQGALPIVALKSQISLYCAPGNMTEARLRETSGALAILSETKEYTVSAASLRGLFLRKRLLQYAEAEKSYRLALELDPGYASAWRGLGQLLIHLERYEEAKKALEESIKCKPESPVAWGGVGLSLTHLGRFEEAEKAFRHAIGLDAENPEPWIDLGNLLSYHLQRYDEAEQAYRRVIEIDPKEPSAWGNLGNLLSYHLQRYDEAEQAYRRVIEIDPKESLAWDNLGILLSYHLKRPTEAEIAYRRAIELDPKSSYPWAGLRSLLMGQDNHLEDWIQAVFMAEELTPAIPFPGRSAVTLIRLFAKKKRSDVILKAVSMQHERHPENREVAFFLVELLVQNDNWDRARKLLENLSSGVPEDSQPDIPSFAAVIKAGHVEQVLQLLERTGADERWRPLYEALSAYKAGTPLYLRRVAPEIRVVAEEILRELAPELAGDRTPALPDTSDTEEGA